MKINVYDSSIERRITLKSRNISHMPKIRTDRRDTLKHDLSVGNRSVNISASIEPQKHSQSFQLPPVGNSGNPKFLSPNLAKKSSIFANRRRSHQKKEITKEMVVDHIPEYREKQEAKFITPEEREMRKQRGDTPVSPSDFAH